MLENVQGKVNLEQIIYQIPFSIMKMIFMSKMKKKNRSVFFKKYTHRHTQLENGCKYFIYFKNTYPNPL